MKAEMQTLPQARQDALFIEQMGDDLFVYDAERHCAHRLNATAAWVWRHCDGRMSIADTTEQLADALQQPVDPELVWLSLETLEKAHLLMSPVQQRAASEDSRRAFFQRMALAGLALALPAITPLTQAASAQEEPPAGPATDKPLKITVENGSAISARGSGLLIYASTKKDVAIHGRSSNTFGVSGFTASKDAMQAAIHGGTLSAATGVQGESQTGNGVKGTSASGNGVSAISKTGTGLYAEGRRAGFFKGDVEVTGDIRLTNADCAEDFDIIAVEGVDPGAVMVLAGESALEMCSRAYDKRVAGVISGAGDYKPGLILDKRPTGNPRKPVALMGKVFVKADAGYGAIEVGDLLTTSDTPGHAMKAADPTRAPGAVLGKALRGLQDGKGLIPILVTLQ